MTDQASGSTLVLPAEILLVYGSLRTGGIETLIVRMANYFALSGINVSIFCTSGGDLECLLDNSVSFNTYVETSDLVKTVHAHHYQRSAESKVLIISFDPISAARGLMLETSLEENLQVIHVSGVFHPRAYFMSGERKDRIFLNYLVARAIGKSQLFFMNEECKKEHSIRWRTNLSNSPILALPINYVDTTWHPSNKAIARIISVGRLVDFKAYNLGAARIVRECLDRGVEVNWDIFGDGPLYSLIKTEIEALGVAQYIRLMGVLNYNDFSVKVAEYDLFIGMGTAALEAAMLGVPTICATVDEPTRCYGYVHDLPFGNVGELQANPPTIEITDLIQNYSISQSAYRVQLSDQSRATAEKYGMPKFAESITDMAINKNTSPNKLTKYAIAKLYRLSTESYLVKMMRRYASKKTC